MPPLRLEATERGGHVNGTSYWWSRYPCRCSCGGGHRSQRRRVGVESFGEVHFVENNVTLVANGKWVGVWPRDECRIEPSAKEGRSSVWLGAEIIEFEPDTPASFGEAFGGTATLAQRVKQSSSEPAMARVRTAATHPPHQQPPAAAPASRSDATPVSVTSTANGMAVAALVLGVVGLLFGLVPLLALFALVLGILAVVFGIAGRRKVNRGQTTTGKGMATAAVILGVFAIVLGFVGFSIVNDAVTDLSKELDQISEDFQNLGTELIPRVQLEIEGCNSDGTTGTVVNGHVAPVDITIEVQYFDVAGTLLDSSLDFVTNLGPGRRAVWEAFYFGDMYDTCRANVTSVWES